MVMYVALPRNLMGILIIARGLRNEMCNVLRPLCRKFSYCQACGAIYHIFANWKSLIVGKCIMVFKQSCNGFLCPILQSLKQVFDHPSSGREVGEQLFTIKQGNPPPPCFNILLNSGLWQQELDGTMLFC